MTHDDVALQLQVALLGEVFPTLRGVGFSLDESRIGLAFFHDGFLTEQDQESISCIETELMALVSHTVNVASETTRIDSPSRLPDPDRWVYRRRE
jgi:hypothetical protein